MKKADISYFNDILARVEETFFHQTGEIAYTMQDLVGIDFIQSKKINGNTLEEVMDKCSKELILAGIIEGLTFSRSGLGGMLLTLKAKGCIHLPKESKLKEDCVRPFICPIANILMDQIHEVLKWDTAKVHWSYPFVIDEDRKECQVKCVVCEDYEKIGGEEAIDIG